MLAQKAPAEIQEINLLEQQISEIIKNAVKHGNKNDKNSPEYEGNAMFAAVEYWDQEVMFNSGRNRVAVKKTFLFDEGDGNSN